jgi:hypothetical protein
MADMGCCERDLAEGGQRSLFLLNQAEVLLGGTVHKSST